MRPLLFTIDVHNRCRVIGGFTCFLFIVRFFCFVCPFVDLFLPYAFPLQTNTRFAISTMAGQKDFQDPLRPSEHLRKYLVASDQLRRVDAVSQQADRRAYDDYMSSLDRQLAEVQQTRAVLAQAWPRPKGPKARPLGSERSSSLSNLNGANAQQIQPETPVEARLDAVKPKPKPKPKPVVVELQPVPCMPRCVGEECPCCLGRLERTDVVMCFPCPAQHVFHSQCLIKWLRSAGSRSTCPMCRAWPRPRPERISPSHP